MCATQPEASRSPRTPEAPCPPHGARPHGGQPRTRREGGFSRPTPGAKRVGASALHAATPSCPGSYSSGRGAGARTAGAGEPGHRGPWGGGRTVSRVEDTGAWEKQSGQHRVWGQSRPRPGRRLQDGAVGLVSTLTVTDPDKDGNEETGGEGSQGWGQSGCCPGTPIPGVHLGAGQAWPTLPGTRSGGGTPRATRPRSGEAAQLESVRLRHTRSQGGLTRHGPVSPRLPSLRACRAPGALARAA